VVARDTGLSHRAGSSRVFVMDGPTYLKTLIVADHARGTSAAGAQ
jgi:hypothetical protein